MIRKPTEELIKKLFNNRKVRIATAKESHEWFFAIYLAHYIKYPSAPFHEDLFAISEDESIKNASIVAFRGSGKSTIMTLSYPLWAILGKQQKKFVVISGQTQSKAKQYLTNIKQEYNSNERLLPDFGPFKEETDEWGSYSLVLPKYKARISAVSSEQSIRGLRHGQHRPDLIICDDVEDLESVKTREGRDKIHKWLTGDVIPAGDKNTKLIVIGNLLHQDSLIMRLRKNIEDKQLDGIFRAYPLIDENGNITWPGKYPNLEETEAERRKVGDEITWQREYLLRIIPDEGQIVRPEWIHYYDELPEFSKNTFHRYAILAVDLAISKESTADYTAIISAEVYGYGKNLKIYILPNPINEKLAFPETIERIKTEVAYLGRSQQPKILIEDVNFQKSVIQQLENDGFKVEGFTPHGQDKNARLQLTTRFLQSGQVLFPKTGAEKLIQQLLGFGVEKHDDLLDALTMLVIKITGDEKNRRFCFGRIDGPLHCFPEDDSENTKEDKASKMEAYTKNIKKTEEDLLKEAERAMDRACIAESEIERGLYRASNDWWLQGH